MPTYEYSCQDCNYEFENISTISECEIPEKSPCPRCRSISVRMKIVAPPRFVDPVYLGRKLLPSDWREFLRDVKKKNPGCSVNDR